MKTSCQGTLIASWFCRIKQAREQLHVRFRTHLLRCLTLLSHPEALQLLIPNKWPTEIMLENQGLKGRGRHSQSGMDCSDMYVAGPVWALFTCDDSRRSGIYAINQMSLSASLQLIKSSLRTAC